MIRINKLGYNVFCYADDVLLTSTSVTGLQSLINTAVNFIEKHGLRFNPAKTECFIKGKNPFSSQPKWYIHNTVLKNCDYLTYLGIVLSNDSSHNHVYSRITSCRKAFYSLQNAGLCKDGLDVKTSTYIWSVICQSILSYGCEAVSLSDKNIYDIDKLQGNLVKCFTGIGKTYRTTPLLKSLRIKKLSNIIYNQNINLLRNIFNCHSAVRNLNIYFMNNDIDVRGTLFNRVKNVCNSFNVDFPQCVFIESDLREVFHPFPKSGEDGLVDSLRQLLYSGGGDVELIRLLLRSF